MKKPNHTGICMVSLAIGLLAAPMAQAQLSGMMQNVMGNGSGSSSGSGGSGMMSGLGGLGGMSTPSLGGTPPTNLAGVLQYCIQNNYLGGANSASSASSLKQSLLSKFTGSSATPTSNSNYASGSNGLLNTGNGNSMSLGGSGLKAQLTQKICGAVLQHAKSLL